MKNSGFLLMIFSLITLLACDKTGKQQKSNESIVEDSISAQTIDDITGYYVTDDYFKRDEGYDWMVVTIEAIGQQEAYLQIQSRSDKKKPTCTFEGLGILDEDGDLKVDIEGKSILFKVDRTGLAISTEPESDKDFLMYFCSGGGNFAGTYAKLEASLDTSQLQQSGYNQQLSLQGIAFDIHASQQGSLNILIIRPSGLEIDNRPFFHSIDGNVTHAEIEDLNSDGSPEVLAYISSAGSGSYGSVIGYSVNNKKSMSQVYLPPITEDPELSEGYMGHDEFAIVETTFARRFPVYKAGDSNNNPTGGIRQVQYKLVDGEASRYFKVDKVVEY